jgi:hypothetical protein
MGTLTGMRMQDMLAMQSSTQCTLHDLHACSAVPLQPLVACHGMIPVII